MAQPLIERLDEVSERIRGAGHLLLGSDFDGTLVHIRDWPDDCYLDPPVGESLENLAGLGRVVVAVLSGRSLRDVQHRVGVEGIIYAGNHGLEIEGPGFSFREPRAESLLSAVDRLVHELDIALSDIPGVRVEHKGLSATVHYRMAADEAREEIVKKVDRVVAPAFAARQVVLRQAKMAIEIRPDVAWHKGHALRWIADRTASPTGQLLPMYFGDDETDEDVFTLWREGITIVIGNPADSSANYSLPDPESLHAFLDWMLRMLELRESDLPC